MIWYRLVNGVIWCEGGLAECGITGESLGEEALSTIGGPNTVLVLGLGLYKVPSRFPNAMPPPTNVLQNLDGILTEEGTYIMPSVGGFLYTRGREALARHLLQEETTSQTTSPCDLRLSAGLHNICMDDDPHRYIGNIVVDASRPLLLHTAYRTWMVSQAACRCLERVPFRHPEAFVLHLARDSMLPPTVSKDLVDIANHRRGRYPPPRGHRDVAQWLFTPQWYFVCPDVDDTWWFFFCLCKVKRGGMSSLFISKNQYSVVNPGVQADAFPKTNELTDAEKSCLKQTVVQTTIWHSERHRSIANRNMLAE